MLNNAQLMNGFYKVIPELVDFFNVTGPSLQVSSLTSSPCIVTQNCHLLLLNNLAESKAYLEQYV